MSLKINPIVATLVIVGILILIFVLFRGCRQSKMEVAAKEKAQIIADSALSVLKEYKATSDTSAKRFQDTIEFERGRSALIEAQKAVTEMELDKVSKDNKALIAKYKSGKYTDTATTLVPNEFISDCQGCFVNLEKTTGLVDRYKNDINKLQDNWDKQNQLYQKRFKELDAEKLGFYNKINSLAKEQQKAADQLKPHGRLYLSGGILWSPVPVGIGAGFMYQNKRNIMWGAKWYYGKYGQTVETEINLPLSFKF